MIRINCFIQVSEENRDQVAGAATILTAESLKEPGCIAYDVFASLTRPDVLMICETWKDEESLESHRQTEHYKIYVPQLRELAKLKTEHFTF